MPTAPDRRYGQRPSRQAGAPLYNLPPAQPAPMTDPDPTFWPTIADAAGATRPRLQAAERLLQDVEPARLDPQQIERMVRGMPDRAGRTPRRRRGAKGLAIGTLLLAASWLAAVAPTIKWAAQDTSNRALDVPAAMQRAVSDPDETRRLLATRVLQDAHHLAMTAMAQAARSTDAWLATATAAIRAASFAPAPARTPPALAAIPIGRSAAALANRHLPIELRLPALVHLGVTARFCWAGMRAAPLAGARASATRDRWLRQARLRH